MHVHTYVHRYVHKYVYTKIRAYMRAYIYIHIASFLKKKMFRGTLSFQHFKIFYFLQLDSQNVQGFAYHGVPPEKSSIYVRAYFCLLYKYKYICILTYSHKYTYIQIQIYMHIHKYIHAYIYTHTYPHTHTHNQTPHSTQSATCLYTNTHSTLTVTVNSTGPHSNQYISTCNDNVSNVRLSHNGALMELFGPKREVEKIT
jgi:hypothetical protein